MVQNVHVRKCLDTCGTPILPCSIGKEWAPTQKWTTLMDLRFVNWKGQLIVGLCVDLIRPCKSLQKGAELGPSRGPMEELAHKPQTILCLYEKCPYDSTS